MEERLVLDPRILLDPRFLGVLQRELLGRLCQEEAEAVLLQTGFFHGRLDAGHALRAGERTGTARGATPVAPLLPMTLGSAERPGVGVCGSWPERLEAEARLASLGRSRDPVCLVSTGYTSGWLSGIWEAEILALEQTCAACGAPRCSFLAREAAEWRLAGDARARTLLGALPFAALDEVVRRRLEGEADREPAGLAFDPASPAIHVWGPVMVIPYSGEETACSIDLIASDPAAGEVSVVIIDLSDALIDPGFGLVALERTVDAIASFGAESILSGVSPLSESAVLEIARPQVLFRKDLGEAIAAAFQIVESQRHPA